MAMDGGYNEASMMSLAANRIRRLVAAVLSLCLSICCCHAHLLSVGWSGSGASADSVAITSCCDPCPGPQDDDPPSPVGCRICCAKGTGLKDDTTLTQPPAVAVLMSALPAAIELPSPDRAGVVARVDAAGLRVEPRTLVGMHCALLV